MMAFFPRPVRPSRALADLWQFLRSRKRSDFVFALLAVAITPLWFYAIFDKLYPVPEYKPPPVFYAKQWRADRPLAEILAQQKKDLPGELKAKREREAAEAARRAQYKKLADKLGIE